MPIIPNIEALKPPEPLDHKDSSFPEEPGTPELDESSDKNYTIDVSDSTHLLFVGLLYIFTFVVRWLLDYRKEVVF